MQTMQQVSAMLEGVVSDANLHPCTDQVGEDQLLLMDAGCEYHGYASDVTRTWPVSGRYTPEQRQVYDMVLSVRQR